MKKKNDSNRNIFQEFSHLLLKKKILEIMAIHICIQSH